MKYEFEKVIDGISKYINSEFFSNMNELQEFVARVFIGRIIDNKESLKQSLSNNGFIKTFGIIDEDGMIEVDVLAEDLKRELRRREKLTISIPMFGKITFKPVDVDMLYQNITGEAMRFDENY